MKEILFLLIALILVGCGGGGDSRVSRGGVVSQDSSNYTKQDKFITVNEDSNLFRINGAKSSKIVLDIKGKRDIYVVVTSRFNNQKISITQGNGSSANSNESKRVREIPKSKKYIDTIRMRREVNEILFSDINITSNSYRMRSINSRERGIDSVNSGDKNNFCVGMDSSRNCNGYVNATIKRVVRNIDTAYGKKSLVVWVADGVNLSQNKIDNLANIFLKSGGANDIYDWVTNVIGDEWGDDAQAVDKKLIPNSNIIDILVYDMHNNSLAGYFWGKDNFEKEALTASNEKIMFYINSELLKRDPKETYTTLVHEFQHMIHFYKRNVLRGIEDSAWYDELMSESMEDLIGTKIGYMGPRHVDPKNGTAGNVGNRGGRFPTFNRYNNVSLTTWYNSPSDYSKVSSFGTYLLRNYNGAEILNRMMFTNNQDEYGLLDATGESNFGNLIANWGSAVILSDRVNVGDKVQYNFNDFKYSSFKGITYELGSINFFNYVPQPQFKSSETLDANGNLYYLVGRNLSSIVQLNIDIPKGADISIIAK